MNFIHLFQTYKADEHYNFILFVIGQIASLLYVNYYNYYL